MILSGSESKSTEILLNSYISILLNMWVLCLEAKPMEDKDSQQQAVSSVAGKWRSGWKRKLGVVPPVSFPEVLRPLSILRWSRNSSHSEHALKVSVPQVQNLLLRLKHGKRNFLYSTQPEIIRIEVHSHGRFYLDLNSDTKDVMRMKSAVKKILKKP